MKLFLLSIVLFTTSCKTPLKSDTKNNSGEREGGVVSNTTETTGSCDEGYIRVPKISVMGAVQDFCVMKYEAKIKGVDDGQVDDYNPTYRAESRASGTPWVSITHDEAVEACANVGAELISNEQWQAIAHNIENVGSNWSGQIVGSGSVNRGHSNNTPASALAANDQGSGVTKRTHALSNGEIIWDLAGNVWEWVKEDRWDSELEGEGPPRGLNGYVSQEPWEDARGKVQWGARGRYNNLNAGERGGLGYVWLRDVDAFARGGQWDSGNGAGVFSASGYGRPSFPVNKIGFRCVRPLR